MTGPAIFPDRTRRPDPRPFRALTLPLVQKGELSNGLAVWVVERHTNPQVVVSVVMNCGAALDPPGKSGLATLTAELLDAGTATRDALVISEAVEFLGAALSFRGGMDATFGTLVTLSRHLTEGIDLFADALTHPVFPASEFERVRRQRLTAILQQKDRAASVATNAFIRSVYGEGHPYGRDASGSERSVGGLTRAEILEFYGDHYGPGNATLIIVGDVSFSELLPVLERALGIWKGAPPRTVSPLPVPAGGAAGVFLIDRPGAPQSEIRIGSPSLPRNTPDFFPATVMNRVLGGQFSSRINMNLRERLGLTYGARSSFVFLKQPGPFIVSGAFTGSRTRQAVEQLFGEIGAMHREGITADEMEFSKKGLAGGFALGFETPFQVAGALQSIALYGLPDDYYERFIGNLEAVSSGDVRRVAGKTLDASKMGLLVVGDAHEIRPGLEALGRGSVVLLDSEGTALER